MSSKPAYSYKINVSPELAEQLTGPQSFQSSITNELHMNRNHVITEAFKQVLGRDPIAGDEKLFTIVMHEFYMAYLSDAWKAGYRFIPTNNYVK